MNAVTSAPAATPKLCPSCGNRYPVDALFCPTDGTPLQNAASSSGADQDPYVGRDILGHIEIKQLAGIGAMGRVYRAFQKGIDRDVAIKILHRELSANQQLVARFHREAKVASRLSHANVVHVYLTGQLPDGSMYIVMEYLDGMSLQSALAAAENAMPLPRALHVALQLCDATGEAHLQGIVHRDIKPENVMLVRRGEDEDFVKVLDFGIARINWGEQSMATAAGLIFGTARYISPEGAQGEQVGPTGDVYAIATLLYQMLSGRTPFESDSAVGLLVQQIHDPPPPIRSIPRAAYLPEPIARAIMKNLSKNPAERDHDARTFGRALIEAAKASGLSPDELLARPTLLGARPPGQVQVASMQRTRQHALDPKTAERIGSVPAPQRTSFQPPSSDPYALTPGAATTKWTPPPGFQAELAAHPSAGPPSFPTHASNVDPTLDDEPPPARPTPNPPTASATQRVAPVYIPEHDGSDRHAAHDFARPPTPNIIVTPPPNDRVDLRVDKMERTGRAVVPRESSRPAIAMGPDTSLGGESMTVPGAGRGRVIAIVLVCFLVGAFGASIAAYKLGLFGPTAAEVATQERKDALRKAYDALKNQRWDQPAGDNVKDLTDSGLSRWPNDKDFLTIRELGCDAVVRGGRAKKKDGDILEALHLVRLGHELDPSDTEAGDLAAEYQKELDQSSRIPPLPTGSHSGTTAHPNPKASASASATPPTSINAVLEASTLKPRVGQPVDLIGRILVVPPTAARPKIGGPSFLIVGPGLGGGMRISGVADDAGSFHAQYTFGTPGRYEVVFMATANATPVRATRAVTVDAPAAVPQVQQPVPPPPTQAPTHEDPPPPQPTTSSTASGGKWL